MSKLKLNEEDIEGLFHIDESSFNGEISEEDRKRITELREEDRKRITELREELKRNFKGCFNCNHYLHDNWKYCPFCGTKKGEGEFNPARNSGWNILLYGPLTTKYYKCKKCHYKWNYEFMMDEPRIRCCPKCGNKNVKMFYEVGCDINWSPRVEDIKFKDIVKFKYREICNFFYRINRKIRSIYERDEK